MNQELIDLGFRYAGEWRTENCKVHREPWLRKKPGNYAFVVDGELCYVGKARGRGNDQLHARLRNYSNRCFAPPPPKAAPRCHVHFGIIGTVKCGRVVKVYARIGSDCERVERTMISKYRPKWNMT